MIIPAMVSFHWFIRHKKINVGLKETDSIKEESGKKKLNRKLERQKNYPLRRSPKINTATLLND